MKKKIENKFIWSIKILGLVIFFAFLNPRNSNSMGNPPPPPPGTSHGCTPMNTDWGIPPLFGTSSTTQCTSNSGNTTSCLVILFFSFCGNSSSNSQTASNPPSTPPSAYSKPFSAGIPSSPSSSETLASKELTEPVASSSPPSYSKKFHIISWKEK